MGIMVSSLWMGNAGFILSAVAQDDGKKKAPVP